MPTIQSKVSILNPDSLTLSTSPVYITSPVNLVSSYTGVIQGEIRGVSPLTNLEVRIIKDDNGSESLVGTEAVSSIDGVWDFAGNSDPGEYIFRLWDINANEQIGFDLNIGEGRKFYFEEIVARLYRVRGDFTIEADSNIDSEGNYIIEHNIPAAYQPVVRIVDRVSGDVYATAKVEWPDLLPRSFKITDDLNPDYSEYGNKSYLKDVIYRMINLIDRGETVEAEDLYLINSASDNSITGALPVRRIHHGPDQISNEEWYRTHDQALALIGIGHLCRTLNQDRLQPNAQNMWIFIDSQIDNTHNLAKKGLGIWELGVFDKAKNPEGYNAVDSMLSAIALDKWAPFYFNPTTILNDRDKLISGLEALYNGEGFLQGLDAGGEPLELGDAYTNIVGLIYSHYFNINSTNTIKDLIISTFFSNNLITENSIASYELTWLYVYALKIIGEVEEADELSNILIGLQSNTGAFSNGNYLNKNEVYETLEFDCMASTMMFLIANQNGNALKP